MKEPVSASRDLAPCGAAICVHDISIIALLAGGELRNSISATSQLAGVRACIDGNGVPIIALLARSGLCNTVSADGRMTDVRAVVIVDRIPIVTLLARLDEPIAAYGPFARIRARIRVVGIGVVALFVALKNAISTDG